MDKQEFLDRLRMALSGNVSSRLVDENVKYYEQYINSQTRLGYGEEEVLYSLGDPRLIAKSIITANGNNDSQYNTYTESEAYSEDYQPQRRQNGEVKVVGMPRWLKIVIGCLITFTVFKIIASVVSALLPVVFPILLVYFLVKLFRDWLN